jgi:hypothetical protein
MQPRPHVLLLIGLAVAGCPGLEPMPPAMITTVAGTGVASFDSDGRPPLDSGLYAPVQVFFQPDGTPAIVDWNNHRVRAIVSDRLITILGTGVEDISPPNQLSIAFSIHHPFQFQMTSDGTIHFAGYHDPRALKVDVDNRVRLTAGIGTPGHDRDEIPAELAYMGSPGGIAVASDGTVYISDEAFHEVRRVDPPDTLPTPLIHHHVGTSTSGYTGDGGPASEASLRGPTRLMIDAADNLYICDTNNHVIRRVGTDGIITTVAGTGVAGYSGDGGPATSATLDRPIGMAMDRDGGLLIADLRNNVIRKVEVDGTIRTVVGNGGDGFGGDDGPAIEATLRGPHGIAVAPDGSLWIADTYNHRIRRVEAGY